MNQWSKQPSRQRLDQKANHAAFQGEEPGDLLPVSIQNSQKRICEIQRLFSLWRRDWKGGSDSLWDHGSVPSATPRPALALSSPSPASLLCLLPCFPSAFSQDQIHGLSALHVITNQWQWAWLLGFLGHSFSPDAWPLTASSLSKGWDLGQPLCLDYFRRAQFQKTSLSIAKV